MSQALEQRLLEQIEQWELVDPHTHINPHAPCARTLTDLLGYHYYTELAHSAGMPKKTIEGPQVPQDPKAQAAALIPYLKHIDNTVQYSWLVEIAQRLFGFPHERITEENWEELWHLAEQATQRADWEQQVLRTSRLQAVFLTNDFDDPLQGFDTSRYVPCLRTDDLVFKLTEPEVQQRLVRATGVEVHGAESLGRALDRLFEHFVSQGAKACAISLPPDFCPEEVPPDQADGAWKQLQQNPQHAQARSLWSRFVFWSLAQRCQEFRLPFDLMIGVNRGVYAHGVYQGQDLFDSRVSLIQYAKLWNAFPQVVFPVSVLASVTNQELVAYSWIFPNVVVHGHWWYSNTPSVIYRDLANRLEAVPRNKIIGYYSDMYKLEFALPKFGMFKRVLARVLAQEFVLHRRWSEQRALDLARQILVENPRRIFGLE